MEQVIMERIDEEHAADIPPEMRGKWVIKGNRYRNIRFFDCICSECYECLTYDYIFCPNCGAKMDRKDTQ